MKMKLTAIALACILSLQSIPLGGAVLPSAEGAWSRTDAPAVAAEHTELRRIEEMSSADTAEQPQRTEAAGYETVEVQGELEAPFVAGTAAVALMAEDDLSGYSSRYGYDYLAQTENGGAKQSLYNAIYAAAAAFHCDTGLDAGENNSVVLVNYAELGLSIDDVVAVLSTCQDDNPIFYWLSKQVYYTESTAIIRADGDYVSGADRAYYNSVIAEGIDEYTDLVGTETSAYQIALAFHDAIIDNIDYAYDSSGKPEESMWAHNVLGVFEHGEGVCETYARTFQLLLNALGVENLYVQGMAYTPGSLSGERHAWNLVRMDNGNWYWFDLTWDDTPSDKWGISYDYFCISDTKLIGGRTFAEMHAAELPSGVGDEYLYGLPKAARGNYRAIDGEKLVGDTFVVDGITYSVVGFHALQLTDFSERFGEFVIPETVTYKHVDYSVIAIGGMNNPGYGDGIIPVAWLRSDITSVHIPKTLRYIWFNALHPADVEEFVVDPENQWFCSENGVLFTASKYTLIQYPSRNSRKAYAIPNETVFIAADSFVDCIYLEQLTIGKNVMEEGVMRYIAPANEGEAEAGRGSVAVFAHLFGSMEAHQLALTGNQELLIHEENKYFTSIDGIIYDAKVSSLLAPAIKGITSVTIPKTVETIEATGFVGISHTHRSLENYSCVEYVAVEEGNPKFDAQDGVLYSAGFNEILGVPLGMTGPVRIAEGITSLGGALQYHRNLQHIILPGSLYEIDSSVFEGCSGLSTIVFLEGLEIIANSTFKNCASLESVLLPETLYSIGDHAFYGCESLNSISLPASLESIGYACFAECTSLERVDMSRCDPYIESDVFSGCSKLSEILLPENMECIPDNMFKKCSALKSVDLPDSIMRIEREAFLSCSNLGDVDLPDQLEYIGVGAFAYTKLTHIEIPETVTYISSGAFAGREYRLETVMFLGDAPDGYWKNSTFDRNTILYYLNGKIGWTDSAYYDAENETWNGYSLRKHPTEGHVTFEASYTDEIYHMGICVCGESYKEEHSFTDYRSDGNATCAEDGTQTAKCDFCEASNTIPKGKNTVPHTYRWDTTNPNCTEKGYTTYTCGVCGDSYIDNYTEPKGHKESILSAAEPTCREEGKTEGKYCYVCGLVIVEQETIPKKDHEMSDWEVLRETTCSLEGAKRQLCKNCPYYVVEDIPKKEHEMGEWEIFRKATCLGEGIRQQLCKNCSYCVAENIPKGEHEEVIVPASEPTCWLAGHTEWKYCSVCGKTTVEVENIPALGHDEVIDPAVSPDCTNTGLSEGSHCGRCGTVLLAQETIPKKEHEMGEWEILRETTCSREGVRHKLCDNCPYYIIEDIPMTAHTERILPAVEPTCTETGLSEGKICSACSERLVAQEIVAALGHDEVTDPAVSPDCTNTGLTDGSHCDRCGVTINAQTVIDALGHDYCAGMCSRCGYDSVAVSVGGDSLAVTCENLSDEARMYLAAYDAGGKFLSLTELHLTSGELTVPLPEGSSWKLIFPSDTWQPLRSPIPI